jgi:hypothetical protein
VFRFCQGIFHARDRFMYLIRQSEAVKEILQGQRNQFDCLQTGGNDGGNMCAAPIASAILARGRLGRL